MNNKFLNMTKAQKFNWGLFWVCGLSTLSVGNLAAQEASNSEDAETVILELEEIIVTARFRDEIAQDIGVSIAAVSNEELRKRNIENVEDLARNVAGLNNLKLQPNSNDVSIRGISNGFGPATPVGFQSSNLVSFFFDDVPITSSNPVQPDINSFGLSRIEILRGPQPTLFGEGAVGGAVRYFSEDPFLDGETFTGTARARFESIEDGGSAYRIENSSSFILVPDQWGLRLTGFYNENEGFIDNPNPLVGQDDINTFDTTGGRVVLLGRPNDKLEIRLSAFVSSDDIGDVNQIDPGSDPDDLTFSIAPIIGTSSDDREIFSSRISYDFGNTELTSVTGYYDREFSTSSFFGTFSLGATPFFPTIDTTTTLDSVAPETNISQEFRLVSNYDGRLNFTAGLTYLDREAPTSSTVVGSGFTTVTAPSTDQVAVLAQENDTEELSGFLELTYNASDRLTLIGGARYVDRRLTTTIVQDDVIFLVPAVFDENNPVGVGSITLPFLSAIGLEPEFDFDLERFLPRVGFEYRASDSVLLYANAAVGARNGTTTQPLGAFTVAGGFAATPQEFINALLVDDDDVASLEFGFKSDWLNGDLILNVGAFYSEYQDAQLTTNVPAANASNGPDQTVIGLELESLYKFNDNAQFFLNLSLLDAEFDDDFLSVPFGSVPIAPVGATPTRFDISAGNEPINTPSVSFSLGYDVSYPIGAGNYNFTSNGTFSYVGERFSSPQNFPATELDSFGNLSLRFGLESEHLSVNLFVDNALNDITEQFIAQTVTTASLNQDGVLDNFPTQTFVNQPRTYGIEMIYRY